jgi:hypothetical protein
MYLAELTELAIGLVVVFFLVSMASSQILEWVSQFLRWRSHDLETAIRGMILNQPVEPRMFSGLGSLIQKLYQLVTGKAAPKDPAGEIVKRLYEHPLIKPLSNPGIIGPAKPANIPARTFALALFDVVMTAGTEASRIQVALDIVQSQVSNLPDLNPRIKSTLNKLSELAAEAAKSSDPEKLEALKQQLDLFGKNYPFAKPLLDLHDRLLRLDTTVYTGLGQIENSLTRLAATNPDLKRTLESLILDAKKGENEIAAARTSVETWFDTTMKQLTDLYRSRSKVWAGLLALGLAAILNIDAITIATALWKEPTLRQSVVAYAEKLEPPPTPTLVESQAAMLTPNSPMTSTVSTTATVTQTQLISPAQTVDYLKGYLEGLQLPIGGWKVEASDVKQADCIRIQNQPAWTWRVWWNNACQEWSLKDLQPGWGGLFVKLAGWALTALAAAQGAPFWFDVLQSLLQLGGKKEPQQQETAAAK